MLGISEVEAQVLSCVLLRSFTGGGSRDSLLALPRAGDECAGGVDGVYGLRLHETSKGD
ncbi:1,4-alpha-glucan branching enzyme [Pseudomonas syringae pv. actinidiae]|uniref:1,4-alpha-glucan branching enzyme n=1 Tax=Pseudomonas syringae pv. actinidiae TaxID=103796 RepID=A0A2V0QMH9_PSESF|nr:1,4-alpha-glucan branching enzyme [Pseudomonas syringae pv. actinidiae]